MSKKEKLAKNEYERIHYWMRTNFGKANECINPECLKKSTRYEWALLSNKEYEFNRDNFIELCKSCHTKYDITEDTKRKISLAQKLRKELVFNVECKICHCKLQSTFDKNKFCEQCANKRGNLFVKNWRDKNDDFIKEHYKKNRDKYRAHFKRRYLEKGRFEQMEARRIANLSTNRSNTTRK